MAYFSCQRLTRSRLLATRGGMVESPQSSQEQPVLCSSPSRLPRWYTVIASSTSCSASASGCASRRGFSFRSQSSLRVGMVPDRQSAPSTLLACTDRLDSETCGAIPSDWLPAAVTRGRHNVAVVQRAPLTTLLSVRPCVRASLFRAVRSSLSSLHSSCFRADPPGLVGLFFVRTV